CNVYASSLLYDADQPQRMEEALGDILGMVDQHYWLPLYGRAVPYANDHAAANESLNILSKPIPCWSIFSEAHITADGWLSACSLDHAKRFRMADLKQCSFAEAWHSPAFQALRAGHLQQKIAGTVCEQCIGYDPA
ncbi:MAG TPA: SPASM domain-containing protein, partial [Burkholderiales bacterium]|nr:SPASM domain-containing protein [Burkholderiales bacterium]